MLFQPFFFFSSGCQFFFPMVFTSIFWLSFHFLSSSLSNRQSAILIFLLLWYFSPFLKPHLSFLLPPSFSFQSPVNYPNLHSLMVFSLFLRLHHSFLLHSFHSNHRLSQFSFSNGVHFISHAYSISFFLFLFLNTTSLPSLYGARGIHSKQIIKK